MRKAIFEWVSLLAAVIVLGPVAGWAVASLRPALGADVATPLVSASPFVGLLAAVLVFALAALAGVLGTVTVSRGMGMASAGFVLVWAACRSAAGADLLRLGGSPVLVRFALEALVLAPIALLAMRVVQRARAADHSDDHYPLSEAREGVIAGLSALARSPRGLVAVAAGVVGAFAGCWLGSVEVLKGQSVFAGVLAGVGAGVFAGLLCAGVDDPRPSYAAYVAMLLAAVLAPLIALGLHGTQVSTASVTGALIPLGRLVPLDWFAGLFLGVPWGLSWVSGMAKDEPRAARA